MSLKSTDSKPCWHSPLAALLLAQLSFAPFASAQMAPQSVPQVQQNQQVPSSFPGSDPMQSGHANEATSKPIDESPSAPMATVEVALPQVSTPLSRDEQVLQVLNRFTYGPRPGDLERVRSEGLSKWFSAQFNPQQIDDSTLEARLAEYPAMSLSIARMLDLYPDPAMIRAMLKGRGAGAPGGEGEKAIYQAQKDRYKDRKAGKAPQSANAGPPPLPETPAAYMEMAPEVRFKALTKLSPAQFNLLRKHLPASDRERLTEGFTPHQSEVLAAFNNPRALIASELVQTKILRDIFSERQLNEVMVDFWLNHFNVYVGKSPQAPYFIAAYERDTIRPRALGHFENLLVATAISPAMLNYLDNASSVGPHSASVQNQRYVGGRFARPQQQKASGLNENYARELMELHTLGVNGGYTQKDVTEVAKVFTGWTLGVGPGGGQPIHPEFDQSKHEPGDKTVLGQKIKEDGEVEGMKVLHLLATSPQTARFVSTKLAIRFVSDDPPPALVAAMTDAFLKTHGDIRQVLVAMIRSPEFFSREAYRAKVKTPQDYVISAVRATGAEVQSASALVASIADLGMPLYGMQTPNGYSMKADPWNSTAALISRMNFAIALSSNRVAGVNADLKALLTETPSPIPASLSAEDKDRVLEDQILHLRVSDRTRQAILGQITATPDQQQASLRQIAARNSRDALSAVRPSGNHPQSAISDPQTALAAGLIFGSPEFQRR